MAPEFKVVRFLKNYDVQSFEGLKYGPFYVGASYALPVSLANELIRLGIAEDTRKEAEEPSLKEKFKGEVLSGYVEAARSRTLNQFEKTPAEIEAKRREILKMVREHREKIKELKKKAEEIFK